jgi:hypothetical protein
VGFEELFENAMPFQEACQADVVTELLESILEILHPRQKLVEVRSPSSSEDCVENVPSDVDDQSHGRRAVNNSPDVKASLSREEPFQEFHFIEDERQAGGDEDKKGKDEDIMLDALDEVHANKGFIIPEEGILLGRRVF